VGGGLNVSKHPGLEELLEQPAVAALSAAGQRGRQVSVFELEFPDPDVVARESHSWARVLFAAAINGDARPDVVQHRNRLVLNHPEGMRVRAYYESGYLEYRDLGRSYSGATHVSNLQEAGSIVETFISKYALWPNDTNRELRPESLRLVKKLGVSEERSTDVEVANAIIIYGRSTEGLPWLGPGSKISALIEGEEVVGFNRHWRQIVPDSARSVEVLPVESALNGMLDDLSRRLDGADIAAGVVEMERANLGYYAGGRRSRQRFLQPAYVFVYRIRNEFTTAGFVDVRPAHDLPLEALRRPPAVPLAQQKRHVLRKSDYERSKADHKAIVRRRFEELDEGNIEVMDELFAPEYVMHFPGRAPMTLKQTRRFYADLYSAFPDLRHRILDQVAEGVKVVTRWRATGTHHGTFMQHPATQRRVSFTGINIYRLSEGKFVESFVNWDIAGLLEQLSEDRTSAASSV